MENSELVLSFHKGSSHVCILVIRFGSPKLRGKLLSRPVSLITYPSPYEVSSLEKIMKN